MNTKKTTGEGKITVKGKFLYSGNEKFYIKGVTYGTFAPDTEGFQFPSAEQVEKDFSMMKAAGFNAVRTYTVPSTQLLDIALKHDLKVMVGLPWEQHITFLDDHKRKKKIIQNVGNSVRSCSTHPAILCFTIGNEIPAQIVRWYGKKRIENFLRELFKAVRNINSEVLVTYVNYPTTEYLDLSFLDFVCFNVYLETPEKLCSYINRLHSLSGDRPLVLAEIGLDSSRNGLSKQAEVLSWQLENIFSRGCAGMFVFAWTDEWWRGGFEIEDWDFGIVNRQREIKPALTALSNSLRQVPVTIDNYPKISVVVCTYNGALTIKKCLEGILDLDYPDFEVIVVNDGSKDSTKLIVSAYPVKLISTSNKGLGQARNTGMHAANGEIIAYIDDDAYPDPQWLKYIAQAYESTGHSCIGGPNIAPLDSEFISTCVANAPGGPIHVMLTDEIAEHVPGCNMTFLATALKKINGFDPIFRNAGDDVDVCWRIQNAGGTIGFHPSAVVWHHRRNSLKAYWKQQMGYGKAEALLESKWPERYNSFGHITWGGRIYGNGATLPIRMKKDKIFHGTWGSSLFQSVYGGSESHLTSIPLMPEWYIITLMIGILGTLGFIWAPLLLFIPIFIISIAIVLAQAIKSTQMNSSLTREQKSNPKYYLLITSLHLIQPVARLYGRIKNGLTPWRKRGAAIKLKSFLFFFGNNFSHWSEEWKSSEEWLTAIEKNLTDLKTRVNRGGVFDKWDLEVKNGLFSKSRSIITIEEHGAGKQLLRFKSWSVISLTGIIIPSLFISLAIFAEINNEMLISGIIGILGIAMLLNLSISGARAMNNFYTAFKRMTDASKAIEQVIVETKPVEIISEEKSFKPIRRAQLLKKVENESIER